MKQLLTLILIIALPLFIGCEGPSGSEGPQGPVGPAGEDGSMMYSGQGAPGADIGKLDDYYLNTNNGELYGPKDDSGWGNPIIVLIGKDGEDGSQIHSDNGTPDASLGATGDYYLDKSSYELYGPKTSSGWGSSLNLKGADGNANVTRYIFPGHDFSATNSDTMITISGIESELEMRESSWSAYLVDGHFYDHIPGITSVGDSYSVTHTWTPNDARMRILVTLEDGSGHSYNEIEVIRIESSQSLSPAKQDIRSDIPDHLDVSNYEAVAKYYGFYRK